MRQPSLSGLISSTACAGAFDPGDASRYLTLIWVPERAGVWLFARNGEWPDSDENDVVVRRWDRCGADLLAAPACRASAHNVTALGGASEVHYGLTFRDALVASAARHYGCD